MTEARLVTEEQLAAALPNAIFGATGLRSTTVDYEQIAKDIWDRLPAAAPAEGLREALASAIDDTLGPPADGISAAVRRSIVDLALQRAVPLERLRRNAKALEWEGRTFYDIEDIVAALARHESAGEERDSTLSQTEPTVAP
jgi:hypothetical protein